MQAARFDGMVLAGHKQAAVEVPFDPAQHWGAAAVGDTVAVVLEPQP